MNFVEYQLSLSPTTVLVDDFKRKQEEVFGKVKDLVVEGANEAVLAGFVSTAPVDALNTLGHNFNLDRCNGLTDEEWRIKLSQAWTVWQTSGTPARLIQEIKDLGFPNVYIIPEWLEVTPGVFIKTLPIMDQNPAMDDPANGFWSNFWVVIDQPHGFTGHIWGTPSAGIWGTGVAGVPYKWGAVDGDQDMLACIVNLIKKFKPAWTSCRGIIFLLPGAKVWGVPHWGDGTLWGLDATKYLVYRIIEDWEQP